MLFLCNECSSPGRFAKISRRSERGYKNLETGEKIERIFSLESVIIIIMIDYEIPKTLKKALYSLMPSKLILQTGYPSSNKVYLTFDDGPYGELTQQTLKYLKEENILATFFVTGEYLKRHPDIILQTLSSGHEIGNHTFSHPQSTHCDVKKTWMELLSVNRMISQLTGALPKLIRPPYGKITVAYLMFALVFRQTIVLWSFDSNDSFILQDQQFLDMID